MKAVRKTKTAVKKPAPRKRPSATTTAAILSGPKPAAPVVPAKWAGYYRALEKARERILGQQRSEGEAAAQPLEPHSMDEADSATDEFDHALALGRVSSNQNVLYEIEEALKRIESGTYGTCEATGKRIPAARLKAVPWTRYTANAEREIEQRGGSDSTRLGEVHSIQESPAESLAAEEEKESEEAAGEEAKIGVPVQIKREPETSPTRETGPARSGGKAKRKSPSPVRLKLFRPDARIVCVAGSFNDWHPSATPMTQDDRGEWHVHLTLEPGAHEYRFVVDGIWFDDPEAAERCSNCFGSSNAVLRVEE